MNEKPYVLFHGFHNGTIQHFNKPSIAQPFWASSYTNACRYCNRYDTKLGKTNAKSNDYGILVMTIDPSKMKAVDVRDHSMMEPLFGKYVADAFSYSVSLDELRKLGYPDFIIDRRRKQGWSESNIYGGLYLLFDRMAHLAAKYGPSKQPGGTVDDAKYVLSNFDEIAKKEKIDIKGKSLCFKILKDISIMYSDDSKIDVSNMTPDNTMQYAREMIVKKLNANCIIEKEVDDSEDFMLLSADMISGVWPTPISLLELKYNRKLENALKKVDIYSPNGQAQLLSALKLLKANPPKN